jgi:acylphosphatase
MQECRKCLVSGHVQGVFYRAATRQRAQELSLTGYARNLADGRVEILVCGVSGAVDDLCAWLWEGPPSAGVTSVICSTVQVEAPDRFIVS